MKDITELRIGVKGNEDLRKLGMEIAQFMFSKSQENLVRPMPWGDEHYSSERRPSKISNTGDLLLSGVPPYWQDSQTIVFRYDAPHSKYVEWGTPPHPVGAKRLVGWVNKKLNIQGKKGLQVAYAIATKIRKEGMDPHPFIRPAAEQTIRKYGLVQISGQ